MTSYPWVTPKHKLYTPHSTHPSLLACFLLLFLSKPTVYVGQSFSNHRQVLEIYAMDMEIFEHQLIIFLCQTLKINHSSETLRQAFKSPSKYNILNFRFHVTNNVSQPTILLTTTRKAK